MRPWHVMCICVYTLTETYAHLRIHTYAHTHTHLFIIVVQEGGEETRPRFKRLGETKCSNLYIGFGGSEKALMIFEQWQV